MKFKFLSVMLLSFCFALGGYAQTQEARPEVETVVTIEAKDIEVKSVQQELSDSTSNAQEEFLRKNEAMSYENKTRKEKREYINNQHREAAVSAVEGEDGLGEAIHKRCEPMVPGKAKQYKGKTKADIESCHQANKRLDQFVSEDAEIRVDPEALAREMSRMAQKHAEILKGGDYLSKFKAYCNDYVSKNFKTYSIAEIETKFSGIDSSVEGLTSYDDTSAEGQDYSSYKGFFKQEAQASINQYKIKASGGEDVKVGFVKPFFVSSEDLERENTFLTEIDRSSCSENKFIEGGTELVKSDEEELSFPVPTDKFYKHFCQMAQTTFCTFKTSSKEECAEKIGTISSFEEVVTSQLEAGIESVKMVGHCYAKKKLEHYVAKKSGHFDETKNDHYFQGITGSECVRPNRYTTDYRSCKTGVNAQSSSQMAGLLSAPIGGAATQLQQQKAQRQYQQSISSGKSAHEAAYDVQKSNLKGQRNLAATKGATYTAAAGTLTGVLQGYPSPGLYSRRCSSGATEVDYCYLLQFSESDNQLASMFANEQAKKGMWGMVGSLGAEALKHGLEAFHFNEMFKQTEGMQNDLNGALEEIATIGFEDPCKANPELCANNAGEAQTSTFSMGSIDFGGAGNQNFAYSQPTESIGEVDSASTISKTEASKLGDSLRESGDKFSGGFNKVSAGKMKGASSSGGGGGGSGGGGAGGGGGSAPGAAPGQSGESSAGISGGVSNPRWSQGKSGSYAKGKNRGKKKSKTGPYANLFKNKKGSRNIASKVNDIASKDSTLFKNISSRYEKLNAKNRLKKF